MGAVVWTMTTGMYYILADPTILRRPQQELKDAMSDDSADLPDLRELENLEYLRGCIDECKVSHRTCKIGISRLTTEPTNSPPPCLRAHAAPHPHPP